MSRSVIADIRTAVEAAGGGEAATMFEAYVVGLSEGGLANLNAWAQAWYAAQGRLSLTATPSEVREYIRNAASTGLKPQTISHHLRTISDLHVKVLGADDPITHILVTSEMKALYRQRGSRAKPIAPLRLKGDVADIVADNPLPGSIIDMLRILKGDQSGWAFRARVVLGIGADTGRNRSDYVRLNIGDVVIARDGSGHALFGANRSASEISEAPKFVSPDTMGFIHEWLEWREKAAPGSAVADAPMLVQIDQKGMPGRRLSVWGYVDVLKDIMRRVGDGAHVSGNSLQAGLKLDLAAIGTTKVGVANALGFRELS